MKKIPKFQPQRKFNVKLRRVHWPGQPSYHKTFGIKAAIFPEQLLFVSKILNQDVEDCTAFSSSAVRASMKGKNYNPQQYWVDECDYDGAPVTQNGTSMETALNVGIEKGWTLEGTTTPHLDNASSYLQVTPSNGMDMFDSMRATMMQANAPLEAGVTWYEDWDNSPNGIVPASYQTVLGGHAIKLAGWKTINGMPYIVVQNSWGSDAGDGGLFYFSREIANKIFDEVYIWSDVASQEIKQLGLLAALLRNLRNLYIVLENIPQAIKNIFNA